MPWFAGLYSVQGLIKLKFKLKKYNKNCYSYRLYDVHNNYLIRGVTIRGLAAYHSPFVLKAFKEKEELEAILFYLGLKHRWSQREYLNCELRNTEP